jgi:ABC-2 type transport system ATP-binding protein
MIEIRKLHKSYDSHVVLKDISLNIPFGSIVGIVGENGAGKTTFFNCLAGMIEYGGEINSKNFVLKDCLGYLISEQPFFEMMTGMEYIQLLLYARGNDANNIEDRNIFDLPLKEYVTNYSTGMKKKLALFAILLQQNEVFILDEPFNGVDIQSNLIIADIIHELKKKNKTVLISSHIFSTLRDTCDVIYHLKNGEIVKEVFKQDFDSLEMEMREVSVAGKIEKLGLI